MEWGVAEERMYIMEYKIRHCRIKNVKLLYIEWSSVKEYTACYIQWAVETHYRMSRIEEGCTPEVHKVEVAKGNTMEWHGAWTLQAKCKCKFICCLFWKQAHLLSWTAGDCHDDDCPIKWIKPQNTCTISGHVQMKGCAPTRLGCTVKIAAMEGQWCRARSTLELLDLLYPVSGPHELITIVSTVICTSMTGKIPCSLWTSMDLLTQVRSGATCWKEMIWNAGMLSNSSKFIGKKKEKTHPAWSIWRKDPLAAVLRTQWPVWPGSSTRYKWSSVYRADHQVCMRCPHCWSNMPKSLFPSRYITGFHRPLISPSIGPVT